MSSSNFRFSTLKMSRWMTVSGIAFILFLGVMLWKCIILNETLAIPNMKTDRSDIFVTLGALFLLGGWTWWLPRHWRPITFIVLNVLLTLLLFSDLVYYRYFQDFISVPVLMQAGQVSALGGSIASLIYWGDIVYFIDWFILIPFHIIQFHLMKQERKEKLQYSIRNKKNIIWMRLSIGTLTLVIGSIMLYMPIQKATSTWAKGLLASNWWNPAVYNITGLYGFHGYDIYRYAKENWFADKSITEEEKQQAKEWFVNHAPMLKGPSSTFGKYKGSNVIVIQAEAFENFVINQTINGQEITPNLNALLKDSMYMNRFFHQTGQGRTSDADLAVQTSLHPLPTGSAFIRYPDHTYDALPGVLKENGYATGAFHAYEGSFWNRYVMYENFGYDYFMSKKDYQMDEPLGWSLGDTSFFRQSVERLAAEQKQPFYAFMIGLTSHHPYTMPDTYTALNVAPFDKTIFGEYLRSIHYVDAAVGSLIEDLKKRGLWDNTILMFYGDHDNSILEREPLAQLLGHEISDLDMLEMKNQVPLIVHLPDGAEAGVYNQVTGQMDIAPTLLHWLGIDTTSKFYMGSNLQAEGERLVVLRTGAATNGDLFFVPAADGVFQNGKCYDYKTRDLIDVEPCRPLHDEAKLRLKLSDLVITRNVIPQLRPAP
ncbi:LTA synthase family protein [Paenibacillus sp. SC116]|uniref:LTA synthase family protein n=1 Tax=Paenibacillus sp. SC116 TaxID=2968986 RepID=UPI00215B5AC4|nr:LTA synthase family protein [Paenibacillus sp. SC116]